MIDKLRTFFQDCDATGAECYFVKKTDESPKRLDFENDSELSIMGDMLHALRKDLNDSETEVVLFSEMDDRKNAVMQYDLDEDFWLARQLRLVCHKKVLDFEEFSHNDAASEVDGLIVVGRHNGKDYALFQYIYPISYFKRQRMFQVLPTNRLMPSESDLVRLSDKVDVLYFDQTVFILNEKLLERQFGLHQPLVNAATRTVTELGSLDWLSDVGGLTDRLDSDFTFARKILRAAAMLETLRELDSKDVSDFVESQQEAVPHVKVVDGKLSVETKSAQDELIYILTDSILTSKLTERLYRARAKTHVKPPSQ